MLEWLRGLPPPSPSCSNSGITVVIVRLFLLSLLLCCLLLSGQTRAEEKIAVIAHASHSLDTVSREELSRIYRGKKLFWEDGVRIIPVNLAADHRYRRLFSRLVLGLLPEEMQEYWNAQYFHGVSPPFVLSSEEAVLRFVAETPGAIGYVSATMVTDRVKVLLLLSIDEKKP
jgi:ABC-type phosphate transport system substrate-binding protein